MAVGEKARQSGRLIKREVIGPPECPLIHRWTLVDLGPRIGKLMVHRFLANADDRAVHDHPRGFVTIVLQGSYDDMAPCDHCNGSGETKVCSLCSELAGACKCRSFWTFGMDERQRWAIWPCGWCARSGVVLRETMRAGMVRRRPARHAHRTRVGPRGCWTIVLMGPLRREWGFFRDGRWWPWREFERRFGYGMRCGDE